MTKQVLVCVFTLGFIAVADWASACDGTGSTDLKTLQAIVACNSMAKTGVTAVHVGATSANITLNSEMANHLRMGLLLKGSNAEVARSFRVMVDGLASATGAIFPNTPTATMRLLSPTGARLVTVKADGQTF
jgi:hypothetical protein